MKDKKTKKEEILECAKKFIGEKGVAKTSTNDIVKELNIARGTFYHYFSSKEAMIDSLVDGINQKYFLQAQKIAENTSIPALERIFLAMDSINLQEDFDLAMMEHIHDSGNALLHAKISEATIRELPKIFAQIVEDGIHEGVFHTPYPLETMELLVIYINFAFDNHGEIKPEDYRQKILALKHNLTLLLGAKEEDMDQLFAKIMEREKP